jgi:hypothetical protein
VVHERCRQRTEEEQTAADEEQGHRWHVPRRPVEPHAPNHEGRSSGDVDHGQHPSPGVDHPAQASESADLDGLHRASVADGAGGLRQRLDSCRRARRARRRAAINALSRPEGRTHRMPRPNDRWTSFSERARRHGGTRHDRLSGGRRLYPCRARHGRQAASAGLAGVVGSSLDTAIHWHVKRRPTRCQASLSAATGCPRGDVAAF